MSFFILTFEIRDMTSEVNLTFTFSSTDGSEIRVKFELAVLKMASSG